MERAKVRAQGRGRNRARVRREKLKAEEGKEEAYRARLGIKEKRQIRDSP